MIVCERSVLTSCFWCHLLLPQSDLVKVYVGPGREPQEVSRITSVGTKAHGLVSWGKDILMLDSDNGALVSLDVASGDVYDLYMVSSAKYPKLSAAGLAVVLVVDNHSLVTFFVRRSTRPCQTLGMCFHIRGLRVTCLTAILCHVPASLQAGARGRQVPKRPRCP